MTYGEALEKVKQGKRVQRSGWNGKGMFIFMRPGDNIPTEMIQKIKTLPQSVKDFLISEVQQEIPFLPYLCMWSATREVVNGWLASQTDMLAEDWNVLY